MVLDESTVTAKGQTTVPAGVRRALGIGYGDRVRWLLRGGEVVIERVRDAEHADAALDGLLGLIERDVVAGRNVGGLPADLLTALRAAAREVEVDLDEPLACEVAL